MSGRFEREARAAARLSHPAIVTLYEAAVDDEGAYLVSELVRGATLDTLLEHGQLSDRDIVGIALALCDALAARPRPGRRPSRRQALQRARPRGAAERGPGGQAHRLRRRARRRRRCPHPHRRRARHPGLHGPRAGRGPGGRRARGPLLAGAGHLRGPQRGQPGRRHPPGPRLPAPGRATCHRCAASAAISRATWRRASTSPCVRGPRERGTIAELRRALAFAQDEVGDEPGIVTGAWTTLRPRRRRRGPRDARSASGSGAIPSRGGDRPAAPSPTRRIAPASASPTTPGPRAPWAPPERPP